MAPTAVAQKSPVGQSAAAPGAGQGDRGGQPATPAPGRGDETAKVGKPSISRSEAIDVMKATLGSSFEQTPCDVTSAVRRACQGRVSCTVPVSDPLCTSPGDGLPPLIPVLNVHYRCGTAPKAKNKAIEKPFTLRIDCSLSAR